MKNFKIIFSILVSLLIFSGCSSEALNSYVSDIQESYAEFSENHNESSNSDFSDSIFDSLESMASSYNHRNDATDTEYYPDSSNSDNELRVHYIDVGQGDSIFIEFPNNENMLIDAGEWEYGPTVVDYISGLGYETINYLVATHPHSDHIGGMTEVINSFNTPNIYLSPATHTSKTYNNMVNAAYEDGNNVNRVIAGDIIIDASDYALLVEVVAPVTNQKNYEELNNSSVIIKITHGENKFIFTGDAEKDEEDSVWTDIKSDVLKVGHHGSSSSTSSNFLKKVSPKYAVISVGEGNEYGHPTDKVLSRLNNNGIEILRTDLLGSIVFISDGNELSYYTENDNSAETIVSESNTISTETYYVLNIKSKKIHIPTCSAAQEMSDSNKQIVSDISGLEEQGYVYCKICN